MHKSNLIKALRLSKEPRSVFCVNGDFLTMLPEGVRFVHMYNAFPWALMGTYDKDVPERWLEEDCEFMLKRSKKNETSE